MRRCAARNGSGASGYNEPVLFGKSFPTNALAAMGLFTGSFTGGRRNKPRKFDYEPRFYDPDEDEQKKRSEKIKRRMRIKSRTRRGKSTSLLYLLILLAFTIYLYFAL